MRAIVVDDIPKLLEFWKENYKLDKTDDLEHLKIFLEKSPWLSTLEEENGQIIGTCLGSFDGRKGYIQKVAVKKDRQGQGLGKKLVSETLEKIKQAGALDIRVGCNEELVPFYEDCGFTLETIPHLKMKQY